MSERLIASLSKAFKATCKFGSVRMQEGARSISIDADKTDVIIGLALDFAGRFDIDVDGEGDVTYPENMYAVSKAQDSDN